MLLAQSGYHSCMARQELKKLEEASRESGLSRNTLLRYMARGWLTRHKSLTGRGQPTLVDMVELRQLMEHPPTKTV
jgi:hypothetical protein